MNNRVFLIVLLVSASILIVGFSILLCKDLDFFLTQKEASGEILSISKSEDYYDIEVSYYNKYVNNTVISNVKLDRNAYRTDVENFPKLVSIRYSRFFRNSVYIVNLRVPKIGILIVDFFLIIISCVAVKLCPVKIKKERVKDFKKDAAGRSAKLFHQRLLPDPTAQECDASNAGCSDAVG